MTGPTEVRGHLAFVETLDTGKTKVWSVRRADDDTFLGRVSWWGAWRRYVFFPGAQTLYDSACLGHVKGFIDARMAERRAAVGSST